MKTGQVPAGFSAQPLLKPTEVQKPETAPTSVRSPGKGDDFVQLLPAAPLGAASTAAFSAAVGAEANPAPRSRLGFETIPSTFRVGAIDFSRTIGVATPREVVETTRANAAQYFRKSVDALLEGATLLSTTPYATGSKREYRMPDGSLATRQTHQNEVAIADQLKMGALTVFGGEIFGRFKGIHTVRQEHAGDPVLSSLISLDFDTGSANRAWEVRQGHQYVQIVDHLNSADEVVGQYKSPPVALPETPSRSP